MGLGLSFGIIVVPFETTASFKFTTEISYKIFALLSPSYSILAPKLTKKYLKNALKKKSQVYWQQIEK